MEKLYKILGSLWTSTYHEVVYLFIMLYSKFPFVDFGRFSVCVKLTQMEELI